MRKVIVLLCLIVFPLVTVCQASSPDQALKRNSRSVPDSVPVDSSISSPLVIDMNQLPNPDGNLQTKTPEQYKHQEIQTYTFDQPTQPSKGAAGSVPVVEPAAVVTETGGSTPNDPAIVQELPAESTEIQAAPGADSPPELIGEPVVGIVEPVQPAIIIPPDDSAVPDTAPTAGQDPAPEQSGAAEEAIPIQQTQ